MNSYTFLIIVAILQCLFDTARSVENFIDDYCWRDYDGIMPLDGFKAGRDRLGRPIYIGQVMFQNKLIPGKIHTNEKEIHFEYYRAYTANETVKILCTQNPGRFKWIKVKYYEVFHLKDNKYFFEGGFERGYDTFVGRAMSHGELTIGKVICSLTNCIRLTTIENGTWYDHDEFEILAYNPDAPKQLDEDRESVVPYLLLFLMISALLVVLFLLLRRC